MVIVQCLNGQEDLVRGQRVAGGDDAVQFPAAVGRVG